MLSLTVQLLASLPEGIRAPCEHFASVPRRPSLWGDLGGAHHWHIHTAMHVHDPRAHDPPTPCKATEAAPKPDSTYSTSPASRPVRPSKLRPGEEERDLNINRDDRLVFEGDSWLTPTTRMPGWKCRNARADLVRVILADGLRT